jgi:hypothetical protein
MVAHLASRVGELEARLTYGGPSAAAAPMAPEHALPSGTIGPERELKAGRGPSLKAKLISGAADLVILAFAGWYLAQRVASGDAAPVSLMWAAAVVGAIVLAGAYYFMKKHKAWLADLAAASSVALWSIIVWHAWQTYRLLEHQTAIGLYVLLFVLLVVMGRWIDRLSR